MLGSLLPEEFDPALKASFFGTICFTFLGAYIWTIFYLLKRVSNFDLSPLSFLRSSAHILFAGFVASVLWHLALVGGWMSAPTNTNPTQTSHLSNVAVVTIGLAFLIGFFPDLAFKAIAAKYPWMRMKRVTRATRDLCEEIPLDCIMGIDPFIKFRLGDFEIEDIQNLATINPIQLFVESPYTLYEVIDWVAQAQLVLAVGSEKTLQLRRLGIRTIFDFEKGLNSRAMSEYLAAILLPPQSISHNEPQSSGTENEDSSETDKDTVVELPLASAGSGDPNLLRTMIVIINEDLHVQRLRQLWDVISMRLEERPKGFSGRTLSKIFPRGQLGTG